MSQPLAVRLQASGCLTALGNAVATHSALLRGEVALRARPVLGADGGESVPLALVQGRGFDETAPPNWLPAVRALVATLAGEGWGSARRPVFVTSSNFGVGSLYAYRRHGDAAHLAFGTPHLCVEWLARELGWGANVTTVSHACVSAHLGLLLATRALEAGLAESALVFSFDFISPFVTGGFNALKILNAGFPAPYADRATGSIGLGDGAAFAVLTRDTGDFSITAQSLHNEMHHFTANRADGAGFAACLEPLRGAAAGRRVWLKGHGTGTLEAGKLESAALTAAFPDAPLVAWKGSLGHTLGSCGLVELALASESIRSGHAPGTVGTSTPTFSPAVIVEPFSTQTTDAVVCASNAFGGAHAAFILSHA
ncbi:MAG: beta-ketoacyl synthase N-terminal-like domain-containing protein [Opitutaceae bacterium]